MLNKFSTSGRLYLLLLITAASLIGIGLYGSNDLKKMNENTRTLYADRVLCMQQLANMRFEYTSDILPAALNVKNHILSFSEAEKRIKKARMIIDTNWHNYKHTFLTPGEDSLVRQTDVVKNQADKVYANLGSILSKEDTLALNRFIQKELSTGPVPIVTMVTRLMELQARIAKEISNSNKEIYQDTSRKFILLILCSLIIAVSLSLYIIKNIKDLFKERLASNNIIKHSEEKYRSLLEHASDAIYLVDHKGNFTEVNDSMCKMTGYSRKELLQLNVEEVIDPEQLKTDPVIHGYNQPGQPVIRERRLIRKDGKVFDVEINVKMAAENKVLVIARDITDRKRTEELILKEKQLSDAIINSLPGIFYLRNENGKLLRWNRSLEIVTGYSAQEIEGLVVRDMLAREDFKILDSAAEKVDKGGYAMAEARIKTKGGAKIPFLLTGSPIIYENQHCLIGTGIDILSRIKAEEELRLSEQKYKLLFESNPSPLWMIAKDNLSVIAVNNAAANLYGYTKDELLNLSVTAFRPDEDLGKQMEGYNVELDGSIDYPIVRHLKKDGTIIFVQTIAQDIVFEGRPVRLSLTNNVTERLIAEESLKKSEANLQTILKTTDTAYALFDLELKAQAFNQKAMEFVKHEYYHLPKKGDSLADFFPVDRFPQFVSFTRNVLKGNTINYEIDYPQADGSVIWYYVSLFPITNDSKQILGMMMALYDITERKNAEHDLKSAYDRIQSHINSIKDMAWKQSHLIRSPLANLKGLAEMLKEDPSDAEVLNFIQNELDRMDSIIIEMGDVSDYDVSN
jgi:two-component system, sporulation sensor kinase E